jgi:molybdenum cofactor cytidylyltransferase
VTPLGGLKVSAIVLAAGRGSRMGGEGPKLLLPWRGGRSILWHAVRGALDAGAAEVIVVVRPDLPTLCHEVADLRVRCVPNPRYEEGMSTSLRAGIAAVGEGISAALVLLGDEPEVPREIVDALAEAYRRDEKPIIVPRYGAVSGPPTLLRREAFSLLDGLEGDTGARNIIARHPELVTFVQMGEGMGPHDVDTRADLR